MKSNLITLRNRIKALHIVTGSTLVLSLFLGSLFIQTKIEVNQLKENVRLINQNIFKKVE